ncbi:MAG: hypothetical protein QOJ12_1910, partial [Thermoleophilales bacterium]|nr:hypothetical protein [Thermoleophilales bacterium]
AAGRRAADRVVTARAQVLEETLASLTGDQREALGEIAAAILGDVTTGRRAARGICRLCDAHSCGHDQGRCPVTRAANAAEASRALARTPSARRV